MVRGLGVLDARTKKRGKFSVYLFMVPLWNKAQPTDCSQSDIDLSGNRRHRFYFPAVISLGKLGASWPLRWTTDEICFNQPSFTRLGALSSAVLDARNQNLSSHPFHERLTAANENTHQKWVFYKAQVEGLDYFHFHAAKFRLDINLSNETWSR